MIFTYSQWVRWVPYMGWVYEEVFFCLNVTPKGRFFLVTSTVLDLDNRFNCKMKTVEFDGRGYFF